MTGVKELKNKENGNETTVKIGSTEMTIEKGPGGIAKKISIRDHHVYRNGECHMGVARDKRGRYEVLYKDTIDVHSWSDFGPDHKFELLEFSIIKKSITRRETGRERFEAKLIGNMYKSFYDVPTAMRSSAMSEYQLSGTYELTPITESIKSAVRSEKKETKMYATIRFFSEEVGRKDLGGGVTAVESILKFVVEKLGDKN